MKRQQSNRSVLLLMEIIIAILFFSIVSAICLQLFVKSHNLSRTTAALDYAVSQTSSIAEVLRTSDNPEASLTEFFPELKKKDDRFFLYYDKKFSYCGESAAIYHITIVPSTETNGTFKITMYQTGQSKKIYGLEVDTYRQEKP